MKIVLLVAWFLFCIVGCKQQPPPKPASTAKSPTIASLVPSATDLLVGMNADDHLVAVSNYDLDPQVSRLPKVGDYENIDWEKVATLRPDILITDYAPGRTPQGMTQRMQQLHVRPLNVKFDRLADIYDAADIIGQACNETEKAAAVLAITKSRIDLIYQQLAHDSRVPALIATGNTTSFAGRNNFLNDLLNASGGQNVITSDGYPTLDREAIAALRPQVIFQLSPGGDKVERESIIEFWRSFPQIPAVRLGRVYLLTERYVMMPGAHVGQMATRFAGELHPDKINPSETSIIKAAP